MYSSKKLRIKYHLRFYVNGVAFEASQLSPRAYHGAEVAVEDGVPAGGVRRRRRPGHRARGSRRLASRHTGTSAKRGAGLQADRAERRLLLSARGRRHGDPASSRAPPHTIPRTDGLRSTSATPEPAAASSTATPRWPISVASDGRQRRGKKDSAGTASPRVASSA